MALGVGDMIPLLNTPQFQQDKLDLLNGVRIVRIAMYPNYVHVSSFRLWNLLGFY